MAGGQLKRRSLAQITGFLVIMSALSRVLGYVREIVMTTVFGQGWMTDAYKAAFLIPDFLYLVLIGGAFSTAFIPVLSEYVNRDREDEARRIASTIFNAMLIAVFVGMAFFFVSVPFIMDHFLAVGYAPETKSLAIFLTRIMLVQSFFMCLSGICQGICHVYQQFTAPAVGSLLYNIAIILFGLLLMKQIGITGFAIGVVVGSFLNFAVHIPILLKIGVRWLPVLDLKHPGVSEFARLALPVVLGLSVVYLNFFVTQNLGSQLHEGTVTALNNANRLMQLPVGIFATAIASAFFPTLTELIAKKDMTNFKGKLVEGINLNNFILIPATVGLMVVAEPLIRALFMQGQFTEDNVTITAHVLVFYSIGIIGYSQQQILNRGMYALRDSKRAVIVNCVIIIINIILSILMVGPFEAQGLALAYSIAGLISMVLLYMMLYQKIGDLGGREIAASSLKIIIASEVMGLGVVGFLALSARFIDITSKAQQLVELGGAVVIGILIYVAMAYILRVKEMQEAVQLFKRKLNR
ncbi:MAG: murein biosynthesis integral membrane protein MurJ [Peptococcaceae bacterium]|nr:murein biosynthesis integral membrane protein MurJ [Peptococcaceae bacterium]